MVPAANIQSTDEPAESGLDGRTLSSFLLLDFGPAKPGLLIVFGRECPGRVPSTRSCPH